MGTPGGMNKEFSLVTKFPIKTGKKATTLFLTQTLLAKVARKLPKSKAMYLKRVGRKPFILVDQDQVRAETIKLAMVTINCGYRDPSRPEWLIPMAKDKLPKPVKEAFPISRSQRSPVKTPAVSQNRIKVASAARVRGKNGDMKNAPEEIFFKSTKVMVANRNSLPNRVLKKLARRPTKMFQ